MDSDFIELYFEDDSSALIDAKSATLRQLKSRGIEMLEGFGSGQENKKSAGDILIPWVNRIRDGIWNFEGMDLQLEVNEVARSNAIHGLIRNVPHVISSREKGEVTLTGEIKPSSGYPFHLLVDTTYKLHANGIEVRHLISNIGSKVAPVAVGSHPYVKIGETPIEDLELEVNAKSRFLVDDRMNPVGAEEVAGTRFDLRKGVVVGELDLDTAYFDLSPESDGFYRHYLTAPNGDRLTVWGDSNFRHVQVYTAGDFETEDGIGLAVAIEPTTAPPNALNSGTDLHWMEPGDTWTATWGISLERNLNQGL